MIPFLFCWRLVVRCRSRSPRRPHVQTTEARCRRWPVERPRWRPVESSRRSSSVPETADRRPRSGLRSPVRPPRRWQSGRSMPAATHSARWPGTTWPARRTPHGRSWAAESPDRPPGRRCRRRSALAATTWSSWFCPDQVVAPPPSARFLDAHQTTHAACSVTTSGCRHRASQSGVVHAIC